MMNRILHSILLLVALAATATAQRAAESSAPVSTPTMYVEQPFDVLHYDASVDLTKAPSKVMTGVCTITLRWVGDPKSGPFHFHLRSLVVDSVFYNDQRVEAVPVETPLSSTFHYEVTSPASVKQNDTVTIRVYYGGTMTSEPGSPSWGGVTSSGGTLFAMGVGIYNDYVSATQHWLPCYDHPSDKATFHVKFYVKSDYAVASNGTLITEPDNPLPGVTLYEWTHNIPCATYLYTFAVDHYVPLEFGNGTLPMQVWSRPEDSAATRVTFKLLPDMVAGFEQRFGKYPFEKVGYVNTPLGAMEHETMVSMPTSLSVSRDTTNPIGAHELAHQWFGDLVSPLDYRHAWLNESFAEFGETVWFENLRGWSGYLTAQTGKLNGYLNNDAPREKVLPLYDFPRKRPSSNYPTTIYSKGAVVVGMLRHELGDSIFFPAIRDYLGRHAYGVSTTEELQTVLEEHAGRSLKWFFDQWVYGKGWPQLVINVQRTAEGSTGTTAQVTIEQVQPDSMGRYVHIPVEVGFVAGDGATVYHTLLLDEQKQIFSLDSLPTFTRVTINQGPSVRTLLKVTSLSGVEAIDNTPDSGSVEFTVRPNPASNVAALTVQAKGQIECSDIQYELYDTAGQRMLVGHSDICEFPVPIQSFSSGTYVMRFRFHGVYYDVPVVIQR